MKKILILTALIFTLTIIFLACSEERDHANPVDPEYWKNGVPTIENLIMTSLAIDKIQLNWQNPDIPNGYIIQIDKKVDSLGWGSLAVLEDNENMFIDSVAEVNSIIGYKINLIYDELNSEPKIIEDYNNFAGPINIQYTHINLNTIKLTWEYSLPGEDGFKINKKVGENDWQVSYATIGPATTEWIDSNAEINENVEYRVYGFYKNEISDIKTTGIIDNKIPAPTDFTVNQNNVYTFTLNWADNSTGEDGFQIERKIDGENFVNIGTTLQTTYIDSTVSKKGFSTVYYQVKAYKDSLSSEYTSQNSEIDFPAPTDLEIEQVSITEASLTWIDNSNGEEKFIIERKLSEVSEFSIIGEVAGSDTTNKFWNDYSIVIGNNYDYRIRAVKSSNNTGYVEKSYTHNFLAPSNLLYTLINKTSLEIVWEDNTKIEHGFSIDKKVGESGIWVKDYALVEKDIVVWNDNNFNPYETNYFRIRAYYESYESENSAELEFAKIIDNMIFIPSGSRIMGFNELYDPEHKTTFTKNFYMGKYEITNQEACDVYNYACINNLITVDSTSVKNSYGISQELINLDDADCMIKYDGSSFIVESGMENRPVAEITWYGSAFFCNMLSLMNELSEMFDLETWTCSQDQLKGFRLPTESEWEYVARYNNTRLYPWGDESPTDLFCNFNNNIGHTVDVGSYSPKGDSALGLCDMAGNANEWCYDWYGNYPSYEVVDYFGPLTGDRKVLRGGAYTSSVYSISRGNSAPQNSGSGASFRIVQVP